MDRYKVKWITNWISKILNMYIYLYKVIDSWMILDGCSAGWRDEGVDEWIGS